MSDIYIYYCSSCRHVETVKEGPPNVKLFEEGAPWCTNPNQEHKGVHHDALEFPDGHIMLLTFLKEGQQAAVLQLPASATVKVESVKTEQTCGAWGMGS
jgi:hypothetical protein